MSVQGDEVCPASVLEEVSIWRSGHHAPVRRSSRCGSAQRAVERWRVVLPRKQMRRAYAGKPLRRMSTLSSSGCGCRCQRVVAARRTIRYVFGKCTCCNGRSQGPRAACRRLASTRTDTPSAGLASARTNANTNIEITFRLGVDSAQNVGHTAKVAYDTRVCARGGAGDCSGGVPPVPIPNTVVKPSSPDDTAGEALWDNRTLPVPPRADM